MDPMSNTNKNAWKKKLVGGFNPFETYDRQIGSFAQTKGWT